MPFKIPLNLLHLRGINYISYLFSDISSLFHCILHNHGHGLLDEALCCEYVQSGAIQGNIVYDNWTLTILLLQYILSI